MSEFVRPAPWLERLFTASRTEHLHPNSVDPVVSLVQPYDGSGWGISAPGQWVISQVSEVAQAARSQDIETVPEDQVCRILAASVGLTAGVAPQCNLQVVGTGTVVSLGGFVTATNENPVLPVNTPIIGPGHIIRGRHSGGDAATVVTWYLYRVFAPLGTVFYV